MKCCDREIEHNFCPICGKRAKPEDSLATLIAHCRRAHEIRKTSVLNLEDKLRKAKQDKNHSTIEQFTRFLISAQKAEAKWAVWVNEIESAFKIVKAAKCKSNAGNFIEDMTKISNQGPAK